MMAPKIEEALLKAAERAGAEPPQIVHADTFEKAVGEARLRRVQRRGAAVAGVRELRNVP